MAEDLAIVTPIYPPEIGGPSTFTKQFALFLAEQQQSFRVFGKYGEGHGEAWYEEIEHKPTRWQRILGMFSFAKKLAKHKRVLAINMEQELGLTQLMHGLSYIVKVPGDPIWEDSYAQGWTRKPLEEFYQTKLTKPRLRWRKFWRSRYFAKAEHIVVPSHYLKFIVESIYAPERPITVIANAIRFSCTEEQAKQRVEKRKEIKKVLWMGRLINYKRPEMVFEIAKLFPKLHFDIAGTGPMQQEIESECEKLNNVNFIGRVDGQSFLRDNEYDIYLNTSLYEGYPHAVIEALGAGINVLSVPNGGCVEVLDKWGGGLVSESLNLDSLAKKLEQIINGPRALCMVDQSKLRKTHQQETLFQELYQLLKNE